MQLQMDFLAKPTSQITTVLYKLITEGKISEQETGFNAYRSRLSDLRRKYQLNIRRAKTGV